MIRNIAQNYAARMIVLATIGIAVVALTFSALRALALSAVA